MPKKKVIKKEVDEQKYETINVKSSTKERFALKFKKYKETDDEAVNRLLDKVVA